MREREKVYNNKYKQFEWTFESEKEERRKGCNNHWASKAIIALNWVNEGEKE